MCPFERRPRLVPTPAAGYCGGRAGQCANILKLCLLTAVWAGHQLSKYVPRPPGGRARERVAERVGKASSTQSAYTYM